MIRTVLQTENAKLVGKLGETRNWSPRPVAVTMREAGPSCPSECAHLIDQTCYALFGPQAWRSRGLTPEDGDGAVTAKFIRGLPPGWLVRHSTSGDWFRDNEPDAPFIDAVLDAHKARPDVQAWTYTHSFRRMRDAGYGAETMNSAGGLTVNASCDTLADAHEAVWEGWPAVITVPSTETRRRWQEGELDIVRCPAETAQVACNTCLLCAKGDREVVIAFSNHGTRKKRADARLEALQTLPMASD